MWRSANSFSASPTANPVGARKRKGWFVVLQSCDRLVPSRSNLHPVLLTYGDDGGRGRTRAHVDHADHALDYPDEDRGWVDQVLKGSVRQALALGRNERE
jgi:hypothetical protein